LSPRQRRHRKATAAGPAITNGRRPGGTVGVSVGFIGLRPRRRRAEVSPGGGRHHAVLVGCGRSSRGPVSGSRAHRTSSKGRLTQRWASARLWRTRVRTVRACDVGGIDSGRRVGPCQRTARQALRDSRRGASCVLSSKSYGRYVKARRRAELASPGDGSSHRVAFRRSGGHAVNSILVVAVSLVLASLDGDWPLAGTRTERKVLRIALLPTTLASSVGARILTRTSPYQGQPVVSTASGPETGVPYRPPA
jgi:hypothetical protein